MLCPGMRTHRFGSLPMYIKSLFCEAMASKTIDLGACQCEQNHILRCLGKQHHKFGSFTYIADFLLIFNTAQKQSQHLPSVIVFFFLKSNTSHLQWLFFLLIFNTTQEQSQHFPSIIAFLFSKFKTFHL